MATIVTRSGKGSALSHVEMDTNLTNLNNDKSETTHTHTGTYQPASSNLDEFAAVNPTPAGLALLDDASASDQLTTLGVSTYMKGLLDDADEATLKASINLEIGVDVQAYDVDTLKADTSDVLTAGFAATPYDAGTKSTGTFTPDEANGNFQYCVNGGAFTLAPPTNNCTLVVQITNNASAGTITTSGFTKVTGTAPVTTNGYDFFAYITKCNGFSHLAWQALQ